MVTTLVHVPIGNCPDCGEPALAMVWEQAPLFWLLGLGGLQRVTNLSCLCGWHLTLSVETVRPTPEDVDLAKEAM